MIAPADTVTDENGTRYTVDRVRESRRFGTIYHLTDEHGRAKLLDSDHHTITKICELCNGSGMVAYGRWGSRPPRKTCTDCNGTGKATS